MRPRLPIYLSVVLLATAIISGCSLLDDAESSDGASVERPTGTNADNGTIVINQETVPAGQAGAFTFTGVPTGTISSDGTLVVSDLSPGTYTTTEIDPAPDFDVVAVACDDGDSVMPSSGDPQTRTAVINVDPGETVTCTFTNAQRGSLVVEGRTEPAGAGGTFEFTGVPTGTIPSNGSLVVANLTPGTYSSTQRDPAPDFDVTAVDCDDGSSPSASSGEPNSRTAVFNLDPGETVTCTFVNTRRGTAVVTSQTGPGGAAGSVQFTGVPSGTVAGSGSLVAANLQPGTYTTTEVDPAPDFELTAVECDDASSASASTGDAQTRTAVFNVDPGETVTCTFTNVLPGATITPTISAGSTTSGDATSGGAASAGSPDSDGGHNPFIDPDAAMENFPIPDDLPDEAGTFRAPKPGPWSVTHYGGLMNCGVTALNIPASPPETGVLEVLDGGLTLIGSGLQDAQGVSITMNAQAEITGRYIGTFQAVEQGAPIEINYFWQVVTDEHIVGFLTSSFASQGVTCSIYRSFEMFFSG